MGPRSFSITTAAPLPDRPCFRVRPRRCRVCWLAGLHSWPLPCLVVLVTAALAQQQAESIVMINGLPPTSCMKVPPPCCPCARPRPARVVFGRMLRPLFLLAWPTGEGLRQEDRGPGLLFAKPLETKPVGPSRGVGGITSSRERQLVNVISKVFAEGYVAEDVRAAAAAPCAGAHITVGMTCSHTRLVPPAASDWYREDGERLLVLPLVR